MIIWILRFDTNRLTIADFRDVHLLAVSLRLMTRLCPLQAFLMPASRDNTVGVGRVRTEVLFNFWYVVKRTLLCGLAPRRTVVIRLSSQGKDVTQTSVEESSDDCKLKNLCQ